MIELNIQTLDPTAILPSKKHSTDAGWDIATIESYLLQPGEAHTFRTGFAAAFSTDYAAVLKDRSSLGSRGIQTLAGVIDATYRGEWKVVLQNTSSQSYQVSAGDRIAQCLFVPVPVVQISSVTELPESTRGASGFGSTGA